jgi:hypothetical protein
MIFKKLFKMILIMKKFIIKMIFKKLLKMILIMKKIICPFLCLIHEVHTSIIGRKTNDVDCYFNFGVNLILKKKKCYNVIFLKVSWSALLLKLYGFVNLDSKTRDTSKQMTVHVLKSIEFEEKGQNIWFGWLT